MTNIKKRGQMCTFFGRERKERRRKKKRPPTRNQP